MLSERARGIDVGLVSWSVAGFGPIATAALSEQRGAAMAAEHNPTAPREEV